MKKKIDINPSPNPHPYSRVLQQASSLPCGIRRCPPHGIQQHDPGSGVVPFQGLVQVLLQGALPVQQLCLCQGHVHGDDHRCRGERVHPDFGSRHVAGETRIYGHDVHNMNDRRFESIVPLLAEVAWGKDICARFVRVNSTTYALGYNYTFW